jgi:lipopolysaccharide export system permease protein
MKSKGIDATAYEVDLQSKLALPIISPLMVLLVIPFAFKKRVNAGLALSFGAAMIIGFGYWVLSAFCISLGHGGALPPWIAGWLPNGVFTLIGLFFSLPKNDWDGRCPMPVNQSRPSLHPLISCLTRGSWHTGSDL